MSVMSRLSKRIANCLSDHLIFMQNLNPRLLRENGWIDSSGNHTFLPRGLIARHPVIFSVLINDENNEDISSRDIFPQ
jgi:hypothetical protein